MQRTQRVQRMFFFGANLIGADHTDPSGDESIGLQYGHQLGILPLDVAHELLQPTHQLTLAMLQGHNQAAAANSTGYDGLFSSFIQQTLNN